MEKPKKLSTLRIIFNILKVILIVLLVCKMALTLLIILPLLFLFSKLISFIGLKEMRKVSGKIQTPVVFYEHPGTKKIVALVATIHIAEQEYFDNLQKIINDLGANGYKVLFEKVGKLTPEEEQSFTPKERGIWKQLDFLSSIIQHLADIMSLKHQSSGLTYGPSWINTDMKMHDVIRLLADHDVDFFKGKDIKSFKIDKSNEAQIKWLFDKIFCHFILVMIIASVIGRFSKRDKGMKKVILERRNDIAFKGITEHLPNHNVVSIWGAAHLRGIEALLKKEGFKEIRKEWFTAYHVRGYSFLDYLKSKVEAAKHSAITATTIHKS